MQEGLQDTGNYKSPCLEAWVNTTPDFYMLILVAIVILYL